jgi:hypothetical protein
VGKAPSLDSLVEPYKGFRRDRARLRRLIPDAAGVWREAFEIVRKTDAFYQRTEPDIVRETMYLLLSMAPLRRRGLSGSN